jgi:hypothetical protein
VLRKEAAPYYKPEIPNNYSVTFKFSAFIRAYRSEGSKWLLEEWRSDWPWGGLHQSENRRPISVQHRLIKDHSVVKIWRSNHV